MTVISQPNVTVNIVAASNDVSNTPQKVLFVGQGGGTAGAGLLSQNIPNGAADIEALFGVGNMITEMILQAREINQITQFDAIPLDDNGSGVDRIVEITFTTDATDDGVLTIILGSSRKYSVEVAVANLDTVTEIATAVKDAIDLTLSKAPFIATSAAGVVTLTARNAGALTNLVGVEVIGTSFGTTFTVIEDTAGTLDPSLTGVFDVIGDNRYQTIVWPYSSTTSEVVTLLDERFNSDNAVLDGVAVTFLPDTSSNLEAAAEALNSQSLLFVGDGLDETTERLGGAIQEIPWAISSQFSAIRAIRFTDGASIARFVISKNGALDSFGGPALASKPYSNTPMDLLPIINPGAGFSKTEVESLLDSGCSVFGNNISRNGVIMGEIVTTYKTDAASNPDISFKFLNFVDTASNAREYFSNNLRSRFAQSRLTEGDLIRGRDMANAESIEAFITGLYADLTESDFVLMQAGEDALQFFKQNLIVDLDLSIGRATVQMTTPLVTQLRAFLVTMKIAFSTTG